MLSEIVELEISATYEDFIEPAFFQLLKGPKGGTLNITVIAEYMWGRLYGSHVGFEGLDNVQF